MWIVGGLLAAAAMSPITTIVVLGILFAITCWDTKPPARKPPDLAPGAKLPGAKRVAQNERR